MYWRRLLAPLPASPVKSDEPLWTSTIRVPSSVVSFILERLFARNIIWQSPISGMNDISSPLLPASVKRLSINFFFSVSANPRFFRSSFHGVPKGGLEMQKSYVSPGCPSRDMVLSKAIYSRISVPCTYWNDWMSPEIIKSALQVANVSGCNSCPYISTCTLFPFSVAISLILS